jgi:hypothetical protein
MQVEQREENAAPEVFAWRRRQLIAAGFGSLLASRLARNNAYDLHALIELVERGCPPRLAIRILAPLDGPADS